MPKPKFLKTPQAVFLKMAEPGRLKITTPPLLTTADKTSLGGAEL